MRITRPRPGPLRLSLAICAFLGASAAAHAQTFISATGSDSNNCSRAAPCRTLQRGIKATPAGRELIILDSGEYGPTATITRSITISAVGVTATVRSRTSGSTAITIDAPGATVALRGLLITGGGTGDFGIRTIDIAKLHIVGCEIERFGVAGIRFSPATSNAALFVTDSVVRQNRTGLDTYIATSIVSSSRFEANQVGQMLFYQGDTTVTGSFVSGHADGAGISQTQGRITVAETVVTDGAVGVDVNSGSASLEGSTINGNHTFGLFVTAGASARVANSVFVNNGTGIGNIGTVETRGNNLVHGNGTNVSNPGALVTLPAR